MVFEDYPNHLDVFIRMVRIIFEYHLSDMITPPISTYPEQFPSWFNINSITVGTEQYCKDKIKLANRGRNVINIFNSKI